VGDAGGYVDALTGEGLQVGFAEAQAAIQAIVRGEPGSYEREWRKITRPYRLRSSTLLWASSQKIIRPLIVPAAKRVPYLFHGIVNSLG
jgi:flavin-dependent dehydrogenase